MPEAEQTPHERTIKIIKSRFDNLDPQLFDLAFENLNLSDEECQEFVLATRIYGSLVHRFCMEYLKVKDRT